MGIIITSYKKVPSAVKLAEIMNAQLIVKKDLHKYKNFLPKGDMYVINWGISNDDILYSWQTYSIVLNPPESVNIAVNKLKTFRCLKSSGFQAIPWFTDDENEARECLENHPTHGLVGRKLLESRSGKGVYYIDSAEDIQPGTKLFVRNIRPATEFRVLVYNSYLVSDDDCLVLQKKRRNDVEYSRRPRNADNGFIYTPNLSERWKDRKNEIEELAATAVDLLNLDLVAVDIIGNRRTGDLYVLEVNTAFGVSGNSTINWLSNLMIGG